MAALPSQPQFEPQMQQHQHFVQAHGEEVHAATLLVRHLPKAIPHETLSRLFAHDGASSVRPCADGRVIRAKERDRYCLAHSNFHKCKISGVGIDPKLNQWYERKMTINQIITKPRKGKTEDFVNFYLAVMRQMKTKENPIPYDIDWGMYSKLIDVRDSAAMSSTGAELHFKLPNFLDFILSSST
ncbi:hypothetical protein MRB53_023826 [Persea americana]|uniref:Uncharacterized protein n=1 Tax=Persea americana TaxID=3435 RepID=A0ACC2LB22_PERAE|nr:hypothetical protein MRB53_023826 [Persea americana]